METDHGTQEMATQFSNRADFKYSWSLKCGQSAVRVKTYSTGFLNVKSLKITFDQHHAEKEKKKERKGKLL